MAKGVPDKKMAIPDVAGGGTWVVGDMITGSGAWMKPYSVPDPDTGECEPHAAISYAACVAEVEVDDETGEVTVVRLVQAYDVGRAINPTLVEGQIEGGAMMGLGLGAARGVVPVLPLERAPRRQFGTYLAPALADLPEIEAIIVENPSVDGPFGAKAIGEMANNAQAPAICAAIHDAVGVWVTEQPATPERVLRALEAKRREPRREGKRVIFDEDISVGGRRAPAASASGAPMADRVARFRSWNGVERVEFVPGVHMNADRRRAGLLCHVRYEPGKQVPLHAHEHTEQVMVIIEGGDGDGRGRAARARARRRRGDQPRPRALAVLRARRDVLRGARARAARPHPGQQRDLVLADGGTAHVER